MYSTRATSEGLIRLETEDGRTLCIPPNPANRHYQEYLEWVAEGNTALVIEEPE